MATKKTPSLKEVKDEIKAASKALATANIKTMKAQSLAKKMLESGVKD